MTEDCGKLYRPPDRVHYCATGYADSSQGLLLIVAFIRICCLNSWNYIFRFGFAAKVVTRICALKHIDEEDEENEENEKNCYETKEVPGATFACFCLRDLCNNEVPFKIEPPALPDSPRIDPLQGSQQGAREGMEEDSIDYHEDGGMDHQGDEIAHDDLENLPDNQPDDSSEHNEDDYSDMHPDAPLEDPSDEAARSEDYNASTSPKSAATLLIFSLSAIAAVRQ